MPASLSSVATALPENGPDAAIAISGLDKIYAKSRRTPPKQALSGVDLTIPRGCLFGLLGPNGAGKSTLINIMAGLVRKTAGQVLVWGYDIDRYPRAVRRSIGVVPQELNMDPFFTPRELLDMHAGLYGIPPHKRRTREILDIVGLADKAEAYARTLSGGMKRRLMVAKSMVHDPPILVLDEPTAGVDVELRQQLWAQIRSLNERGVTVLLTTHYLEEAEQLCDRIAIINHGRLIACDTTEALLQRMDQKELTVTVADSLATLPETLRESGLELEATKAAAARDGSQLTLRYRRGQEAIGSVLMAIQNAGLTILDVSTLEPDLEDIFIALTSAQPNQEAAGQEAAGQEAAGQEGR